MNKIVKDALILTAITLIAGVCLTLVYEITKDPIAQAQEESKQNAYREVLDGAEVFESIELTESAAAAVLLEGGYEDNTLEEAAAGYDSAGNITGYVLTVTSHQGYGGDIRFTVGILEDGTVNGLEMLSISETAGLGMKAKDEAFRDQYSNKQVEAFTHTKNGAAADDEIDVISGATITTGAVTDGVNAALYFFRNGMEGGQADE